MSMKVPPSTAQRIKKKNEWMSLSLSLFVNHILHMPGSEYNQVFIFSSSTAPKCSSHLAAMLWT